MTAPVRVLHIHSGNIYGGIETILTALVRLRDACPDFSSAFALCFEGRLADELREAGAPVYPLGEVRFRKPWTVWRARRRLRELLRRERFDVVLVHSCWSHALFAGPVRRHGLPIAHWVHGASTGSHWQARLARRNPPNLVLANSRFIASQCSGLFPGVPVEVQYPFCERPNISDRAAVRREVRAELGTPEDTVVIVTVSRMEQGKGNRALVAALEAIKELPGWRWWLVGGAANPAEHAHQVELQTAVKSAGLDDRVALLGARGDVPKLLAAADVFCLANTTPEGFGLVFVEAMLAGLPVVTTAIGGALEIVGDTCGVLVPPDAPAKIATALRPLIADAARRTSLGTAGARRASEQFEPTNSIRSLGHTLGRLAMRPTTSAPARLPSVTLAPASQPLPQ